jgi:hypothetical protein
MVAEFVRSTDFASAKPLLEKTFQALGYPRKVRSDNGALFSRAAWANYCEARGIERECSTPGPPQQNGLAERYMQTVNKAITRAVTQCQDPAYALKASVEAHNIADHRITGISPEVLMFGRRRRGILPILGNAMVAVNGEELRTRDAAEKDKAREREDRKRRARETDIRPGDSVLLKRHLKAKDETPVGPEKFKVIGATRGDLTIEGESGKRYKRNVIQLRKVGANGESAPAPVEGPAVESERTGARPERHRKAPAHLTDYITMVQKEE